MSEKINYKRLWGTNSTGGGSSIPVSITYSDLSTLINSNSATEGFYLITDATSAKSYGAKADLGILVQVFKDSLGVNQVRLEAEGTFLNSDYQNVGDYSGITAANTNIGVWHSGLAPSVGNIVIWTDTHYKNITGANGALSPDLDLVNWTAYNKTTSPLTRGYIKEVCFILYDFTNDTILLRKDTRNNSVIESIQSFQWGNDNCIGNTVQKNSQVACINSRGVLVYSNFICNSYVSIDQTFNSTISAVTFDGTYSSNLISFTSQCTNGLLGGLIQTDQAITVKDTLKLSTSEYIDYSLINVLKNNYNL